MQDFKAISAVFQVNCVSTNGESVAMYDSAEGKAEEAQRGGWRRVSVRHLSKRDKSQELRVKNREKIKYADK